MPRRTRQEQIETTRAALLTAAEDVFLRRGYVAATLDEITDLAGVSRTASYRYFRDKEELWLAVAGARLERNLADWRSALDASTSDEELLGYFGRMMTDPDERFTQWTLATTEFLGHLGADDATRQHVLGLQLQAEELVTELLVRHCRRLGVEPAIPPADLTVLVLGLLQSIALRRALDPSVDADRLVRQAFSALLAEQLQVDPALVFDTPNARR